MEYNFLNHGVWRLHSPWVLCFVSHLCYVRFVFIHAPPSLFARRSRPKTTRRLHHAGTPAAMYLPLFSLLLASIDSDEQQSLCTGLREWLWRCTQLYKTDYRQKWIYTRGRLKLNVFTRDAINFIRKKNRRQQHRKMQKNYVTQRRKNTPVVPCESNFSALWRCRKSSREFFLSCVRLIRLNVYRLLSFSLLFCAWSDFLFLICNRALTWTVNLKPSEECCVTEVDDRAAEQIWTFLTVVDIYLTNILLFTEFTANVKNTIQIEILSQIIDNSI